MTPRAAHISLGALLTGAAALGFASGALADAAILAIYAALFIPWAALLAFGGYQKLRWSHLLVAAIAARAVLLFADPLLSDDIFRYVWDGRVAASGINPFVHPPAAEELAHLRDSELWPHINHPDVPTIYPPVAQMLFRLNAALGGGDVLLRLLLLLVEASGLALIWTIFRPTKPRSSNSPDDAAPKTESRSSNSLDDDGAVLDGAGMDGKERETPAASEAATSASEAKLKWPLTKYAFTAYALCPLVFVEIAWSGHVDVLAWTPLVAALLVFWRVGGLKAAAGAGALFGLSFAAKFLGVLALPLILFAPIFYFEGSLVEAIRRRTVFVAAAAAIVAAAYFPYADAGPKLFSGFGTYASDWQGNDGVFRAATALSEQTIESWAWPEGDQRVMRYDGELIFTFRQYDELFMEMGWTRTWQGMEVPSTAFTAGQLALATAKALAAFLVGLAMLWALFVRRNVLTGTLFVLLALFFVAPVVHPWYVAWLVPLAALMRSRAALVFSFTVLAAYLAWFSARNGGAWEVPVWAVCVEYGVVGVVAFWEAVRAD